MTKHDLKIWPEHFEAVMAGLKKVELRLDDRGFAAGDELDLREWDRFGNYYTGRQTVRRVAFVGRGLGLALGYVALSLEDPDAARRGTFLHELAQVLDVRPAMDGVEEEALLGALRRLKARAGEDERLPIVLQRIQNAHHTVLMGSGPSAKAELGEAARVLAAVIDGRA